MLNVCAKLWERFSPTTKPYIDTNNPDHDQYGTGGDYLTVLNAVKIVKDIPARV